MAGVELIGFALTKARPDLFDQRQQILATLQPVSFEQFPPYEQDRVSGLLGIAAATERQCAQIAFVNVGHSFDWSRFFRGCHPSADGYAMIAAQVASALRPLLSRERRRMIPKEPAPNSGSGWETGFRIRRCLKKKLDHEPASTSRTMI